MKGILYLITSFIILSLNLTQNTYYDETPEYIYSRYVKGKAITADNRNVMKLICIHDGREIQGFQLAIAYNSIDVIEAEAGLGLIIKLYNGEYITLHSINKITKDTNIKYKEQVKIRHKAFFVYSISNEALQRMLKYGVSEFTQYVSKDRYNKMGLRNTVVWDFNEILQKQYNDLVRHLHIQKGKKVKSKKDTVHKPSFGVNTLYKEGRISYLRGDCLTKTDPDIYFDLKWIEL